MVDTEVVTEAFKPTEDENVEQTESSVDEISEEVINVETNQESQPELTSTAEVEDEIVTEASKFTEDEVEGDKPEVSGDVNSEVKDDSETTTTNVDTPNLDLELDLQYDGGFYDYEDTSTTEKPVVSSISQSLSEAVNVVTSTISSIFETSTTADEDFTETEKRIKFKLGHINPSLLEE